MITWNGKIHPAADLFPMIVSARRQFITDIPEIVRHDNVIAFLERCESPAPVDLWDEA